MFSRESVTIVLVSIAACVAYGIVHDQITARICAEYFTVFHPPVFGTDNPTVLGLGWGILATWWVGLFLGIPLAIVCRMGSLPKRSASDLVRPIGALMLVTGCAAAAGGLIGFVAATQDWIRLTGPLAAQIPSQKHVPFLVNLWTHNTSYCVGFLGGLVLISVIWRSRRIESQGTPLGIGAVSPGNPAQE